MTASASSSNEPKTTKTASTATTITSSSTSGYTLGFAAGAVLLCAAHLACTFYFDPPSLLFGSQPVSGSDYDTHIEQTWRVIEGLRGWGKSWVYDVHLLAGSPNGVIFDADNKGWELWTYALESLGLSRAVAFNSFLLLAHLLVLPVMFCSARLFELSRRDALIATALGSAVWFFDSYTHWIWWVGTLAFAFASYFFLLPLALFYRFTRTRGALAAVGCGLAMAVAHLIHPYSFFLLFLPLGALYLRARPTLKPRDHAWVASIVIMVLAANFDWLYESLRQWHYVLDSGYFGQAKASQSLADFFGVLIDTSTTGIIYTRTAVRFLCLIAGGLVTLRYARLHDPRFLPIALGLGFMLGIGYVGGFSHTAAQVQPYRFIGSAAFLTALPAAEWLGSVCQRSYVMSLTAAGRISYWVVGSLLVQHLASQALTFFSSAMPAVPPLLDGVPVPITSTGFPPYGDYRHVADHHFFWTLPKWIDEHRHEGRFLVQNGALGEQLAWKTDAEIIGGFMLRNLEHSRSNLFRRKLERNLSAREMQAYFEAYAIRWVVLTFPDHDLERRLELFEPEAHIAGALVVRTKVPISWFERGYGTIKASTNRIAVSGTDPNQDLVLRYHFHEMLACRPGCRLEPHQNPVGGVPFIRVPSPHPATFTIENSYRTNPDAIAPNSRDSKK